MEIKTAIKHYLTARKDLLHIAKSNNDLSGNDNIIGSRIGEFIAMSYYKLIKGITTQKVHIATNPGYDLTYILNGKTRKVSVKLITAENQRGYSTRLKKKWDEFVLIELGLDYEVIKIGRCDYTSFRKERKRLKYSEEPVVKRTMLGVKGMITMCAGEIATNSEILKLNKHLFE